MNIKSTKQFFTANKVVALKADKDRMPEVTPLLKQSGNPAGALPYYAVYGPGLDGPIAFEGLPLTTGQGREVIQQALDATPAPEPQDEKAVAAGK